MFLISFSQEVKNELAGITLNEYEAYRKYFIYGLFYGLKKQDEKLTLITENAGLLKMLHEITAPYKGVLGEKTLEFLAGGKINRDFPLDCIKISGDMDDGESGLFLRGIYIACGMLNDPGKTYHLEFSPPGGEKCEELFSFINERGIYVKKSARKNQVFLYIKESEVISDFLTYIGAPHRSMEIMNVKIIKEVRNNINRSVNCETSNIGKVARAAIKQIQDIEYILAVNGKGSLAPELMQIASLRLDNAEMSLREIGERCEPRLSRSGVNHRLQKISAIAEELKTMK